MASLPLTRPPSPLGRLLSWHAGNAEGPIELADPPLRTPGCPGSACPSLLGGKGPDAAVVDPLPTRRDRATWIRLIYPCWADPWCPGVSPGTLSLGKQGAAGSLICASRRRGSSSPWYRVGCSVRPKQAPCPSVPWGGGPRCHEPVVAKCAVIPVGSRTLSLLQDTHWRGDEDGLGPMPSRQREHRPLVVFGSGMGFMGSLVKYIHAAITGEEIHTYVSSRGGKRNGVMSNGQCVCVSTCVCVCTSMPTIQ